MVEHYAARFEAPEILVVTGDLGDGAEELLRQDLRTFTADHATGLIVDLSGVTFFPSAAISVVVDALRQAEHHGADLRLRAKDSSVTARVLDLCGVPHQTLA